VTIQNSVIRTKRSIIDGYTPNSLKLGEMAVNTVNKRMFIGDGTNVVELTSDICQFSSVVDKRSLGIHGGTNREKHWNVRTLTTIEHNKNTNVTLVGDDFRLKSGTYYIQIAAPVEEVGEHKLRIWNETTNSLVYEGQNHKSKKYDTASLSCIMISNGIDLFEIQHYTEKEEEKHGLGKASNIGSFEIYTTMLVIRIGD